MGVWSPYHDRETRYFMCEFCGRRLRRKIDVFGNWDEESYYCPNCSGDDDDDDDDDD